MFKPRARSVEAMVLAFGIIVLAISGAFSAGDEDKKATAEAQKDIIKLTDSIEKGNGDARAQAQAIYKKYEELRHVMNIFKPRDKGGIGLGPQGKGDGIELKINDWANKRQPSPTDLKRMAGEIERASKITRAVADVTDLYVPKRHSEEWKKYTQGMREAAEEWARAARGGDPPQLKKASSKLYGSCCGCHGKFRND